MLSRGPDLGLLVNASVEEYMTMVAAGLVGSTPHMISATITTISRLLFEFKGGQTHPAEHSKYTYPPSPQMRSRSPCKMNCWQQ